jgi:hypothetical protein
MAINRDIKYINRDFGNLRQNLINYSKTYFPTTYNDFTESSPGMMFMELSAYVGDVLSFYQDNQFQETFLQYAREAKNLYDLAYMMGYKPKTTGVALVDVDFYQTVPESASVPDYNYALLISENSQISTPSGIQFLVEDPVDFDTSSSLDPTTVSIYEQDGSKVNSYLLKKTRKAISATINETTFSFSSPQEFATRSITANNIIGILDIVDSDGNAPSNTTLTVRYLTGGGATANVSAGSLTTLSNSTVEFQVAGLVSNLADDVFNSLQVNNPLAASGGSDGDTNEEIRQNAISNFSTQLRSVTQNDYLVRALSMPPKYGVVSKAYIEQTKLNTLLPGEIPSTLSLYVLSANAENNLTLAGSALKQNLQTYLSQYRVIGDSLNIKDAFIVNIGVDFEITVRPNFNSNEVLRKCLIELQTYFNINNWQINEPIQISELFLLLDKVQGVQTVKNVFITNKVGESLGYSKYAYDIPGATLNGVIYPSIDPMIFEVKYPTSDIKGKTVNM